MNWNELHSPEMLAAIVREHLTRAENERRQAEQYTRLLVDVLHEKAASQSTSPEDA